MGRRQGELDSGPSARQRRRSAFIFAGVVAAALLALAFAGFSGFDPAEFLRSRWAEIDQFVDAQPLLAGLVFIGLYMLATVLLLPGVLWLTLGAGAAFGALPAAGLTWVAATVGSACLFLIARGAFGGLLETRAHGWVARLRDGFQGNAFQYMLSLRLLPFAPYFAVNLAPAFLGVPLRTFVLATALGMLPGIVLYATIGAGLGTALGAGAGVDLALLARPEIVGAFLALAALVLLPTTWRLLRRGKTLSGQAPQTHVFIRSKLAAGRAMLSAAGRKLSVNRAIFTSLSGRLLALTALFVLVADVLALAPSLSSFHNAWLAERVTQGQIAALALESTPDPVSAERLREQLLRGSGVELVALKRQGARELRLGPAPGFAPTRVRTVDLRTGTLGADLRSVLETLLAPDGRTLRILSTPRFAEGEFLEVLVDEGALAGELRAYARGAMVNSLFVGLITGALVYATLVLAFVRPMAALTQQILRFRARPQDASIAIRPSGRDDEIGRAEQALAEMEEQVRQSLRQRERLAALGSAVAKISHDMRASLASAQLVSERLATSEDPMVRQIAPRLERSIERAGALASAALLYGKADESTARLEPLDLKALLDEAALEALARHPQVQWRNAVRGEVTALADADQAHRVFANLIRNAAQAIERQTGRAEPGTVAVTATPVGSRVLVRVVDDGPGLPEAVKERLFEPFSASSTLDGAGLGLAIARELAQGQGGELRLISSSPVGVAFEVELARAELEATGAS